jgi:hypothetical protein
MTTGFETIHNCEHDGVRHVVLYNTLTGAVIKTETPLLQVTICHCSGLAGAGT